MNNKLILRYFKIGHLEIRLGSNHPDLLDYLFSFFQYIISDNQDSSEEISIVILDVAENETPPFVYPKEHPVFFEGSNAQYHVYKDLLITEFSSLGKVVINREKGKFLGFTYASKLLTKDSTNIENFLHPLWELFRHYGLYSYHSGAVCYNDKGILLAGKSGQGKTTLTMDLVSHGFEFLSDDRCLLKYAAKNEQNKNETNVDIIGFNEPVRIYPPNLAHIKDLSHLQANDAKNKIPLAVETLYPQLTRRNCSLRAIVFPAWSPGEISSLEPITPTEAFLKILPLTMVCFNAETSLRHFDFNYDLVAQFPSIVLKMGDDKEHWHSLVIDFL